MLPILADVGWEWEQVIGCLTAIIILVVMFSLLFFVRRLQHKEIMAAIEKGIPLPELRETRPKRPRWITNISIGIGFLIVSLPFLFVYLNFDITLLTFGVLFAVGAAFLVRGLLQRKI